MSFKKGEERNTGNEGSMLVFDEDFPEVVELEALI
jgi:hypothetical protein